jgi:MFS family permease
MDPSVEHPTLGRVVVAAVLATTAGSMPIYLMGGLAVQASADTGIGLAELGGLASVYFGSSLAWSVPAGRIVRRLGVRRSILATLVTSVGALLGIAVLGRSILTLGLFMAVAGFSNGTVQPAVNQMIARTVREGRRGLVFGVKQAAVPLGGLLGGLAVPTVGLTVGWRWAFVIALLTPLAAAIALPPHPEEPGQGSGGARPASLQGRRGLLALAVGAGFSNGSTMMLGTFFVTSTVAAGLPAGRAGLLLSLGSLVGIATRVVAGGLADRRGADQLRRVRAMYLVATAGFLLLAVEGPPGLLLVGSLVAFAASWGWHGLLVHAVVAAYPDDPASATATTQAGTYAGGIAGPLLFGVVSASSGFGLGWSLAACCTVLGALLLRVEGSRERAPRRVVPPRSTV